MPELTAGGLQRQFFFLIKENHVGNSFQTFEHWRAKVGQGKALILQIATTMLLGVTLCAIVAAITKM